MLIAIMGGSFNTATENNESYKIKEHLQIIVENSFLIDKKKYFKDAKYIFSIKEDKDDIDGDEADEKLEILSS